VGGSVKPWLSSRKTEERYKIGTQLRNRYQEISDAQFLKSGAAIDRLFMALLKKKKKKSVQTNKRGRLRARLFNHTIMDCGNLSQIKERGKYTPLLT